MCVCVRACCVRRRAKQREGTTTNNRRRSRNKQDEQNNYIYAVRLNITPCAPCSSSSTTDRHNNSSSGHIHNQQQQQQQLRETRETQRDAAPVHTTYSLYIRLKPIHAHQAQYAHQTTVRIRHFILVIMCCLICPLKLTYPRQHTHTRCANYCYK